MNRLPRALPLACAALALAVSCAPEERSGQRFDDPAHADCSKAPAGFPTVSYEYRQSDTCLEPAALKGTLPEGAPCSSAADCEPRCCACEVGPLVYLAAACSGGKCQGTGVVCCSPDRPMAACE